MCSIIVIIAASYVLLQFVRLEKESGYVKKEATAF